MAVLNPPRTLPGLGRAIVNYLLDARRSSTEEDVVAAFKPEGLNSGSEAAGGLTNTISSLKAINMLDMTSDGNLQLGAKVPVPNTLFTADEFRRTLQFRVFDFERDGDIWATRVGDGHTSGGRDLNRALTWILAQDALGRPLAWSDNVEKVQTEQFQTTETQQWAISNDARWPPTVRWILALGLATQSVISNRAGIVPLPVIAVEDALYGMPSDRMTVQELLSRLGSTLPVIHGGTARSGLATRLGSDPDPGVAGDCVDSSIAQSLRILEGRGRLEFETLPDAEGIPLSRFDGARLTHVSVKAKGKTK